MAACGSHACLPIWQAHPILLGIGVAWLLAGKHVVQKKAVVGDSSIDRSGALLPDYTKGMLTGQSK
ncbi:hypothetical protein C9419_16835 [Paraburkholderia fungorum]|nr:hypothetical protein C9419_16835 [Paraburkholderia fungorum]